MDTMPTILLLLLKTVAAMQARPDTVPAIDALVSNQGRIVLPLPAPQSLYLQRPTRQSGRSNWHKYASQPQTFLCDQHALDFGASLMFPVTWRRPGQCSSMAPTEHSQPRLPPSLCRFSM